MPNPITSTKMMEHYYGPIIDSLGTRNFGQTIREVASDLGIHDIFGFVLRDDFLPNPIFASSDDRANFYSKKYYSLDPMLKLLRRMSPTAPISAYRVRAADIKSAAYRRDCFESGSHYEKLCFAREREGVWSVLNIYRVLGEDEPHVETCRLLAEVVVPLIRKHAAIAMRDVHNEPLARIEHLLRDHFPILTYREVAVCARTAIGRTAQEISDELGIAKSSVLTYRRRAYVRLNVSSASQLLHRFAA